jgi:hypothetical protein
MRWLPHLAIGLCSLRSWSHSFRQHRPLTFRSDDDIFHQLCFRALSFDARPLVCRGQLVQQEQRPSHQARLPVCRLIMDQATTAPSQTSRSTRRQGSSRRSVRAVLALESARELGTDCCGLTCRASRARLQAYIGLRDDYTSASLMCGVPNPGHLPLQRSYRLWNSDGRRCLAQKGRTDSSRRPCLRYSSGGRHTCLRFLNFAY